MPPEIISVECLSGYDPPMVVINIANELPLQVSLGLYDYLLTIWPDLPPDPCAGS